MPKSKLLLIGLSGSLAACAHTAQAAAVEVYKKPSCGCCTARVEQLRNNGFNVRGSDMDDATPVARKLIVPHNLSCCQARP